VYSTIPAGRGEASGAMPLKQVESYLRESLEVAGRLRIKQIRSVIGRIENQRRVMRALGITRLYQTVEHKDTPQIRGMIQKVNHLVKVEEV